MRKRRMIRKTLPALCLTVLLMVFGMPTMAYGAGEDSTPATSWTDLAATSFAGGDGSKSDPYQISAPEELAKLSKDVAAGEEYEGKYFKLTSDIDLSGHIWVPIGLYEWDDLDYGHFTGVSFRGSLDGDGHTITNMTVDQRTDQHSGGLFGNIQNAGNVNNEIKNLIVKDARIYSSTRNMLQLNVNGILSAVVSSDAEHTVKITNVDTSGIITRVKNVSDYDINGGMLGQATRATVTNCHVRNIDIAGTDEKNGPNRTGGFVGYDNNSSYDNCTAAGFVSGKASMGGFVGCTTTSTSEDADTASTFKHCMADVEVHASDWNSGGFAGYAEYTIFENCVAKGDVTSTVTGRSPKVGGFTGDARRTTVENSHAAGKVTSTSQEYKPGGFIGHNGYGNGSSNCSFDSEKNPGIKASLNNKAEMIDVVGIEGVSTQAVKANICRDYDGKHQVKEVAQTATCTEDGNDTYYICENCGTMYSDADQKNMIQEAPVIKATGHTFGEWKVTKKPTTEAEGTEERVCENCQYTETRSIAKLTSAPENSSKNNSARTGDDSNLLLPLTLMMAAAAAGGITILRRKTNK